MKWPKMTIIKYVLLFIGMYVYNWHYLINFTSFKYQFFNMSPRNHSLQFVVAEKT